MNPSLATPSARRYESIDVMRGIAVMGILAMNIVNFALPEAVYSTPVGPMSGSLADRFAWLIAYLFFDGKMMGLFTLLFGASALLMMDRLEMRGNRVARGHFSRMAWLSAFGLMHLLLIWRGDILFYYALCGFVLYFARFAKAHQLLVAGILLTLGTVILSAMLGWSVLEIQRQGGAGAADMVRELRRDFGYDPMVYTREIALYRGSYAEIAAHRFSEISFYLSSAVELVPRLLGAMLIGAGLYRSGFLTGEMRRTSYWMIAAVMAAIALPAQIVLACLAFRSDFSPPAMFGVSYAFPALFQLMMAVGYAALIMLVGKGSLATIVGNVGRMSFSNYIGTSVVMTTLFYGYGFSLFGTVARAPLALFALAACVLMLLASNLWLARFTQGPLEYLWRRLAGAGR